MDDLQHKIFKLIEAKRLTKRDFAKKLDISYDTVYNLNYNTIKFHTIVEMSEIFEKPIDYFLEKKQMIVAEPKEIYKKNSLELDLIAALKELNECRKENKELRQKLSK